MSCFTQSLFFFASVLIFVCATESITLKLLHSQRLLPFWLIFTGPQGFPPKVLQLVASFCNRISLEVASFLCVNSTSTLQQVAGCSNQQLDATKCKLALQNAYNVFHTFSAEGEHKNGVFIVCFAIEFTFKIFEHRQQSSAIS